MMHLGDITNINGSQVPMCDCVIGGSPCQNLSVAGNREGLNGEQSHLFMKQIRVVKEMRNCDRERNGRTDESVRPRYMVWENVPGAFSSNKGEDFRTVLEELARIVEEGVTIPRPEKGKWATTGVIIGDGYSIAWRVCDAQYWGVPQRRRRIVLVADFDGYTAPYIVFGESKHNGSTERGDNKPSSRNSRTEPRSQVQPISESLSGHTQPSKEERQETSTDASESFGTSDIAFTMQERAGKEGGGKGALIQEDRSAALRTFNSQYLFQPVVYNGAQVTNPLNVQNQQPGDPCYFLTTDSRNLLVVPSCYAIDIGGGEPAVVYDARGNGDGKTVPTMTGDHENRVSDYTGLVVEAVIYKEAYGFDQGATRDVGALFIEDCSKALANGTCPGHHNGVVIKTIALEGNGQRPSHRGDGYAETDKSYTLNSTEVHGVVYSTSHGNFHMNPSKNIANTLEASDYKDAPTVVAVDCRNCAENDTNGTLQSNMAHSLNGNNVVRFRYIVRRLTPLECERLQGFPDGWTDIGDYINSKGKKCKTSDAVRYKALGNSIALPSWRWIVKRISAQYERNATMASLFDGIGGFPLIWEQINGKGSCLWASEIEDFPMAVTKERIG